MANKFLEKLKKENERLKKEAENRGNFEKIDWFKPEMGDNMVRILPRGDDLPYVEVYVHYIPIQKRDGGTVNIPIRCLTDVEKDCPLCNAYEKMVKKDKEKAKNLLRRRVFLYNVINYSPKERKVQPYAAGIQVHEQIMGYAADVAEEDVNVFSEKSGRDWKIVKSKNPAKKGNFAIEYKVRPSIKATAIPEKVAMLVEGAVDLTTLYPSEEGDLKKMKEYLGGGDEEEEAEDFAADFAEEEDAEEDLPKTKAPPAAVAKAKAAAERAKAAKPAAKKPEPEEEEDFEEEEDLGVDSEDEDLEAELRDLGV